MKKLILLISILICSNLFGQTKFVSATSQGWAGGICCNTGTNYVITIKGNKKEIENMKVNSVCIDGKYFDSTQVEVYPSYTDTLSLLSIRCSISFDHREDVNYLDRVKTASCGENNVLFMLNLYEHKINIEKITELEFIAYP